jgi:hypothetical protein
MQAANELGDELLFDDEARQYADLQLKVDLLAEFRAIRMALEKIVSKL